MSTQYKKTYLFANWKMYLSFEESAALAKELAAHFATLQSTVEMVVFPSALATQATVQVLQGTALHVGAQNVYSVDKGGYTGEISSEMYRDIGVTHVLVGHSERRHIFHESNHDARQKVEAVLAAGLVPVLCLGETKIERERGETQTVLETQLRAFLQDIVWPLGRPLFVAYEPVWAISRGTGTAAVGEFCEPLEAEKMHILIAQLVAGLISGVDPLILFGGSVRPHTVQGYLAEPHIAGVLVGAASTDFVRWQAIVKNAVG